MAINLAKAWRDLADPITPINAEKNAVANSPSKIKFPEMFVYQTVSVGLSHLEMKTHILYNVQVLVHRIS